MADLSVWPLPFACALMLNKSQLSSYWAFLWKKVSDPETLPAKDRISCLSWAPPLLPRCFPPSTSHQQACHVCAHTCSRNPFTFIRLLHSSLCTPRGTLTAPFAARVRHHAVSPVFSVRSSHANKPYGFSTIQKH